MRVTLIGSGNLATHLGAALKNAGHQIVQVYSPNVQNAAILAYHIKAEAIDKFELINTDTEIFLIAVKDAAIEQTAQELSKFNKLVVHTSGATSLQTIQLYNKNAGVFYPLQTFSKFREIDFSTVPLCIEGADEEIKSKLVQLAQTISKYVYQVDSEQRKILHLAAVFACNFPNYLYNVAHQLLKKNKLDFDLIRPLILETAQKVQNSLPAEVQTGPAVRNDQNTMNNHLQLLDQEPGLKAIYQLLSQEIIKNANANHLDE